MPEMGETGATPSLGMEECLVCNRKHANPKRDEVASPGWKRKTMSGVGPRHGQAKRSIYPGGAAPPTAYLSSGHHCLALSSFIDSKDQDRNLTLNFYLNDAGYDPNNADNAIDLPREEADDYAQFEQAVMTGHPLQLHLGRHVGAYFKASHAWVARLFSAVQQPALCEQPRKDWLEILKKEAMKLEDRAFEKTAGAEAPFVLHPGPLSKGEIVVRKKHPNVEIKYPKLELG